MAKVYITEYQRSAKELFSDFVIAAAQEGDNCGVVDQTPITTTGTSAQSAAFAPATKLVRIHTDGIISVKFGAAPTADVNTKRMAANTTEYFGVRPGDKVALITNT